MARISIVASIRAADRRLPQIGGLGRATTVIVGALVVLQSSQELDAGKIVYLVVAALAVAGSVWTVYQRRADDLVGFAKPWLIASMVLATIVGASLPVALLQGTPFSTWIRDAAAYGLVVVAPWVALDVAWSISRRTAAAMIVATGGLATISYAIVWWERRAMADVPIDRLVLPSFMLATALFAFAVGRSVAEERHRYRWAGLASITVALLLFAGTRTTFAILIVPFAVLGVAWLTDPGLSVRRRLIPAVLPLLTAAVIVASTQFTWSFDLRGLGGPLTEVGGSGSTPGATPDPRSLEGRFETFGSVLGGRDASLQDRIAQTRAAWAIFLTSPLVGHGLGVVVPWTRTGGQLVLEFTADTPLLVLAKLGLLGLVLVGVLAAAWIITIRRLKVGGATTRTSRLTLVGYGAAIVLLTPFGWQLEDKGLGLAVMVLLALAFVEARQANAGHVLAGRVRMTAVPAERSL